MTAPMHRRDFLKMTGVAGLLAGSGVVLGREHEPVVAKGAGWEQGAFDGTQYVLPDLPYDYGALEPLYQERTLRLHHGKHHAGYVRGLNATLHRLDYRFKKSRYERLSKTDPT